MKKFKEFVNENILNEGSDWILLRSAKVCVDSRSLCFLPLKKDGTVDMELEIDPDDPEYQEVLNKLDEEDKERYEYIKQESGIPF